MSIDLTELKKFLNKEDTYIVESDYRGFEKQYPATLTKVNKVSFVFLNRDTGEETKEKVQFFYQYDKDSFTLYRSNTGYCSPITIWSSEEAYLNRQEHQRLVESMEDFVRHSHHEDLPLDRLREIYKLMKEVQ